MDVKGLLFALKVDNVAKDWNGKRLFEHASLQVSMGERVALIGRNGVGKTSFLDGLIGRTTFDEGVITRGVPLNEWGWVEQQIHVDQDMTLFDFVHSAHQKLSQLKAQMAHMQQRLEMGVNDQQVVDEYLKQMDTYADMGGYEYERSVEVALKRLGLNASLFSVPYAQLSGGQKTRAQFAKLSILQPQFLLLDEPTNHLDAEMLQWLESWLISYPGSILFVSHDRHFIDAVANTTYELTPAGTKAYKGGYTAFRAAKDMELRTQQSLYHKQQQERKALLEAIQRYKQWYERAHHAASERDPVAKKKHKNMPRVLWQRNAH